MGWRGFWGWVHQVNSNHDSDIVVEMINLPYVERKVGNEVVSKPLGVLIEDKRKSYLRLKLGGVYRTIMAQQPISSAPSSNCA